jgi:hypothetical protein
MEIIAPETKHLRAKLHNPRTLKRGKLMKIKIPIKKYNNVMNITVSRDDANPISSLSDLYTPSRISDIFPPNNRKVKSENAGGN